VEQLMEVINKILESIIFYRERVNASEQENIRRCKETTKKKNDYTERKRESERIPHFVKQLS
jgi:hypothetical protein